MPGDLLRAGRRGHGSGRCSSWTSSGASATSTRPAPRCSSAPSPSWSAADIWEEFPEAVGSPFERHYREVRRDRRSRPASRPGSVRCGSGSRPTRSAPTAGLVVTYDDVTERRRMDEERAAAVDAREEAAAAAAAAAAEAELAGRHLMLLGDINLAMTSTLDTDEAVQRFAELVVPQLADWCLVSVVDPDGTPPGRRPRAPRPGDGRGDAPVRRPAGGDQPGRRRRCRRMLRDPPAGGHPRAHRARSCRPWCRRPEARAALAPLRPAAVAAFPLIARGEVIRRASPWSTGPSAGAHTEAELRTAEIASRRAALALDNARLVAAPAAGGRAAAAEPALAAGPARHTWSWRSGTGRRRRASSIGGDWYDAFLQPDGDTVLVIGDVMGHDIEAAAAMGQVKTLVRGIAYDRPEAPAERAAPGRPRAGRAGVAGAWRPRWCARVEQDDGDRAAGLRRLRWASAGHPTRCCSLADGTVVDLDGAGRAAAGHRLARAARRRRAPLLPDGSTLLLFTDGLFERRGDAAGRGPRRRLRATSLGRSAGLPLDVLCDRLLAEMLGDGVEDDVAVLAVRAHPVDAARPAEAGPEVVPPALPPV